MREPAPRRDAYRVFRPIPTRWSDNDVYGHVNNVRYYSFFDTVVNGWLVDNGLLDIADSPSISVVVETGCRYYASLAFPELIEAGLAVARLGTSSMTYRIGIFGETAETASAAGHFTHVHVDRQSRRPVPIPDTLRAALEPLITP